MNILMKVAIGAVAAIAVAIIGINLSSEGSTAAGPSAGSTPRQAPNPSASSLPIDAAIVHGWPGPRRNPAGIYSWDGLRESWMHDPNGESVGVSITFSPFARAYESEPTAVTIAGHDGTYHELPMSADGIRTELWIVDVQDTSVTITVEAQPSTTGAELAEAHAIIGSIRSESKQNGAGFRLTFTLPDGWDSG